MAVASKEIIRSDCLSTDRINGQFDDDLILCPICTNILWKPVACQTCENCFCLNCIRLWLNEKANTCPFNCYFKERKAPGILLKLLSKLKLDCENKFNGCTMIIPYEALEKHQFRECECRLMQCSSCSKKMFFKDYEKHREESCLAKKLTCLKCSTIYQQKEGHTEIQCLEKQISILETNFERSGGSSRTMQENFDKLTQLYTKLLLDEDYAKKCEGNNSKEDFTPSAPPEESFPTPYAPFEEFRSPSEQQSLTTDTNISSGGNLRISTVNFSFIKKGKKKEGDHIPNGYAGFNWNNAYYIFEEYVKERYQLKGFLNSFTDSIKCVAYNGHGNPLSIHLPNPSNRFDLHSFAAISIYHDNLKISTTGFRSNIPILTKQFILNKDSVKIIQLDFEQIDKIIFTPAGINVYSAKLQTFALIYLNFLL